MSIESEIEAANRFVTSLRFTYDGVEVSYMNKNQQSDTASLHPFLTLVADGSPELEDLYFKIQNLASLMIDIGEDMARNIPDSIPQVPLQGPVERQMTFDETEPF